MEKRLDDALKRDKDLVVDEGYAGTTVISVALAKADDADLVSGSVSEYTERFFHSVTMFCHEFQYNLRGPAWAVGSCSISPPAKGTFQKFVLQTLRQSGKNAL